MAFCCSVACPAPGFVKAWDDSGPWSRAEGCSYSDLSHSLEASSSRRGEGRPRTTTGAEGIGELELSPCWLEGGLALAHLELGGAGEGSRCAVIACAGGIRDWWVRSRV